MSTDQLIQKAIDGNLPLGLLALVLSALGLRSLLRWAGANYWPKHVEWREKKMAQEAAAEIRQAELLAAAFRQSAELHNRTAEWSAQHELNDEKRHHVVLEHLGRVVAEVKEDVACEIAASEQRIIRETRRLAKDDSGDIPAVPPTRTITGALILFSALTPGLAEATDARIVIECRTTTIAVGAAELETCLDGDETTWLDFVVGAQVIALQLTGGRKVVELGAAPSLGLLIAWRPAWWTATRVLLGGEALVSATVLALDRALSHLEIWTVAAINLLGYLSIGIGGRYGIATSEDASDFAELVLTSGLRVPI